MSAKLQNYSSTTVQGYQIKQEKKVLKNCTHPQNVLQQKCIHILCSIKNHLRQHTDVSHFYFQSHFF